MKKGVNWFVECLLVGGLLVGTGCKTDDGEECTNECLGGTTRCNGDAVETCGDHDGDGCLEFGNHVTCPTGESCSFGVCSDPNQCTDECTLGTTVCVGDAVASCGELDSDACADLGTPVDCAEGESCSNGVCGTQCTDECTVGTTECLSFTAERVCGEFDSDACLDWGPATQCGTDEVCIAESGGGACAPSACDAATSSFDEYQCQMQWSCPDGNTYSVYCHMPEGGGDWGCMGFDCIDCMPICEWSTGLTGLEACENFTGYCTIPPPGP